MQPLSFVISFVVALVFAAHVEGSIFHANYLSIDFTKQEDAAAKATWESRNEIAITATEKGLGRDAQPDALIYGWIQSKPLAVGLSWRAASSVVMSVTIDRAPKPTTLKNGESDTRYMGQVYARFSPDTENWSTWQPLTSNGSENVFGTIFTGSMGVPKNERTEYSKLIEAYSKLDVLWVDDEEAAVKWILERDAKFFERSLPFIGYVEFLLETPFYGGERITSLEAEISYNVSGFRKDPKDPEAAENRDVPWRFKAIDAIVDQDNTDQPAIAGESKSEIKEEPKSDSNGRSQ